VPLWPIHAGFRVFEGAVLTCWHRHTKQTWYMLDGLQNVILGAVLGAMTWFLQGIIPVVAYGRVLYAIAGITGCNVGYTCAD
jgi:hypothetical protein